MDPLTHALSGALLARAAARFPAQPQSERKVLPLRMQVMAGFAAAAFPDVDFALRLIDTLTYLNWHQGPTHSLILLPLWTCLLARLFSWFTSERYPWKLFALPVCLGIAIHIVGDLITSYGLMLFSPLSTERFSLPLVFVIDPWFSLIIIVGLVLSWRYPRQNIAAIAALAGLCSYCAFLWTLQQQAIGFATQHVQKHTISHAHISVLPQPLSPLHWKIIIQHGETYHLAEVNLRQSSNPAQNQTNWLLPKMAAAYRPVSENNWQIHQQFGDNPTNATRIREAWLNPAMTSFRAFAQFPLVERMDTSEQSECIWFYDLRFKFPKLPPSFRYGVCRENDHSGWQMSRQRGSFYID